MGNWDELEGRLTVEIIFGGGHRKSRAEDLDHFEAEFGVKLPESYRDYATAIGPGELGNHCILIYAPGFPRCESYDLAHDQRSWIRDVIGSRSDESLAGTYGDGARARRLVRFGRIPVIGHGFAWDPGEVTDPDGNEYAIYMIDVDHFGADAMVRVASTFPEFIKDFALGHGYARQVLGDDPTSPSEWDTPGSKIDLTQVMEED
jgi:SMI1 / KNR4 family (SUKH-1)